MPRFSKETMSGYDLDEELFFKEVDGRRYMLNSIGQILLACNTCGCESSGHFECLDGHGPLEKVALEDLEHWRQLWTLNGLEVVSAKERRVIRLEIEQSSPGRPHFYNRTEADFPLGYVEPRHHH